METHSIIGQASDPLHRAEGKRYIAARMREQQPRSQTFQDMLQRANQALQDHGAGQGPVA